LLGAGVFAGLAALGVGAGRVGAFGGTPPSNLGVSDGRLRPPSRTDNSVSSQAGLWPDHPQRLTAQIDPLLQQTGEPGPVALQRLRRLIEARGDAQVVESRPDYLRVSFRTRWLGFVDDAEFWADPAAGVIQLRSASRVGRRDFGVNRARIEALRAALMGS
jgi:uncharacterized protein (DUF1499 family)